MKKGLPKIFQNRITKPIKNNSTFFYGECRGYENPVDHLFKVNETYKTKTKITLKDYTIERTIIGRTQNNLITHDSEIIPISEIIKIDLI